MNTQAHVHHYVPQWYQRRFLPPGRTKFHYLDLHPDTVVSGKVRYQRRALLHWGPARCFYKDDLYTLKLGNWTTDQIEKRFFGEIDNRGRKAVELFGDYNGYRNEVGQAFQNLTPYMDAQRFRTPRGLDWIKKKADLSDHRQTLVLMQRVFQLHATMWAEGVWEIAKARHSPTKFIVTDEPVTFFNRRVFPGECPYPGGFELDQIGTRTLFPLGLDSCLIITHTQLVRNPWINPNETRVNPRAYQPTMTYLLDIQFGRELEQDEVLRINFILKKRATRYIAAAEGEWLYPERRASTTDWSKLDNDWFLFPHLYKVPFKTGTMAGYKNGSRWAQDEYGRRPNNPKYNDEKLRDKEWETHLRAQKEWAKKRSGRSVAHIDKFEHDEVFDKLMQDYLSGKSDLDV
jgi:hypothetical protein